MKDRIKVSLKEISEYRSSVNPAPPYNAPLPRDFFQYKPKLYRSLICPSYVHGYSLAIEYMKKWFIDKFGTKYFRYVHINGKHVLDDWKHFNKYNIVREKPMLAIVPTVDFDNDRDQRDSYLMDHTLLLKRSNFQQSFFKNYQTMDFIYMQMRELKMDFAFKIRVNSRSEQLDLFNRMELWFRVGSTQHEYISADFHIPYDIMISVAQSAGFEVKNDKIIKIYDFIKYINKHSDLPIIYKMRAINQKPEFFVRARRLYTHISTMEKLQMDDGDRQGNLDTNFHVEMRCTLKIPIPHFYAYFCQDPKVEKLRVNNREGDVAVGIYSIAANEIPYENEYGWSQLIVTGYMTDIGEEYIDMSQLFSTGDLKNVIDENKKQGILPDSFLDIRVYRGTSTPNSPSRLVPTIMDYGTNKLYFVVPEDIEEDLDIVIYADKLYMNSIITSLENFENTRIASERQDNK